MKMLLQAGCLLSLVGVSMGCHPDSGQSSNSGGHHGGSGGGGHHGRALPQKGDGSKNENFGENEGELCADPEMVGRLCLAGTSMGKKMGAAIDTCINSQVQVQVEETGRRRKIPKGKGKNNGQGGNGKGGNGKGGRGKCPTFGEIIERIRNETAVPRCVIKEMGWIDAEGNLSLQGEAAQNDLKSLHPSILENMALENSNTCHKETLNALKKSKLYKKCKNKYSDEDQSQMREAINSMILGKCSKKIFIKSCSKYVAESFLSFMEKAVTKK